MFGLCHIVSPDLDNNYSQPTPTNVDGTAGSHSPHTSSPKTLTLKRQLGPRTPYSPVWLCETICNTGQAVDVVLKLCCPPLSEEFETVDHVAGSPE